MGRYQNLGFNIETCSGVSSVSRNIYRRQVFRLMIIQFCIIKEKNWTIMGILLAVTWTGNDNSIKYLIHGLGLTCFVL